MNLPYRPKHTNESVRYRVGYREGHRDARHAAAELVAGEEARRIPVAEGGGELTPEQDAAMSHILRLIQWNDSTSKLSSRDIKALYEVHQLVRNQQIALSASAMDLDTACKVAFAEMFVIRTPTLADEMEYERLEKRFTSGERTPQLLADMQALTSRITQGDS